MEQYSKLVYNFAYQLAGNETDAQDLAQEAFIKVYRNLDKYREGGSFVSWLYRVIRNVYVDGLRANKDRRHFSLDVPADDGYSVQSFEFADSAPTPEQFFLDHSFHEDIELALRNLPSAFRAIVVLCDIHGFSYEEISQMLNIPVGTVRSRLSRARMMLRKEIMKRKSDDVRRN